MINKDELIFKFLFNEAMRDATLQKSFDGERVWLKDCNFFPDSKNAILGFVKKVTGGVFKDQVGYDKEFKKTISIITKDINDRIQEHNSENEEDKKKSGSFEFGNAQKLLNMILKLFYVCSFGDDEKKKNFQWCHCPMDGQMLGYVWENRKNVAGFPREYTSAVFLESWGKMSWDNGEFPDRYVVFQKAIRELAKEMSPLEFDLWLWPVASNK